MSAERKHLDFIPDSLEYWPHQVEGVRTLARSGSMIVADEMGLGKSIQALTTFAVDVQAGWCEKLLVVCPATLKTNWYDEIEDHTLFKEVTVLGAEYLGASEWKDLSPKKREQQLADFDTVMGPRILIVNYEQVVKYVAQLNEIAFDVVIYDEAHMMKNPRSARTKACFALTGKRHLPMSGSPMLNHVDELWALLHRIAPDDFPNYWAFRNRYCNTPDAPIWMADGTFKVLGKVQIGDEVMGWDTDPGGRRRLTPSTVEGVNRRTAPKVVRATLASGRYVRCTPDHVWLSGNHNTTSPWTRVATRTNHNPTGTLSHVIDPTPELTPEQQREADWLGGVYDGEASRYFISQHRHANPAVWERIGRALTVLNIPHRATELGYSIKGGRQAHVNFLNWCNPTKRDWLESRLRTQLNRTPDRVVSLEDEGPQEVIALQTSTGNYVAWGYASKNCVFGGYKNKQIVGVQHEPELNRILQSRMLRRRKADVLDLPDKQYITVKVPLHPEQRRLIKEIEDEMRLPSYDDAEPEDIQNALTKFLRIKQICGTTATIEGYPDQSIKLDQLMEDCWELMDNGHKVAICTQFRGVLAAIIDRCDRLGFPRWQIHGDVPKTDRVPEVKRWAAFDGAGIMAFMAQVGGVGLNMTASRHLLRADKLFVPKLNEQVEDRLHRIGADKSQPVQIRDYLCVGTAELRVEQILKRKTKVFNDVVEDEDFRRKLYAALKEAGM